MECFHCQVIIFLIKICLNYCIISKLYLGKVRVDESLLESNEHGQRSDQLEFGVAEGVADGGERSSAVRFAFLGRGRVHEQANTRHERRGDGHANETASGENAGQKLCGFTYKHSIPSLHIILGFSKTLNGHFFKCLKNTTSGTVNALGLLQYYHMCWKMYYRY